MLGRKEVSSAPAGLALVKSVLSDRSKEAEFGYEQQVCLDYANRFCKLSQTHYDQLLDNLKQIEGLSLDCAIKIADILPAHKSSVQVILAKDKITLDDSQLLKILELVTQASKDRIEPIIASIAQTNSASSKSKDSKEDKYDESDSKEVKSTSD